MTTTGPNVFHELNVKPNNENASFRSLNQPRESNLTGIKIAITFAFMLSLAALAAAGFLYQTLNSERRERVTLTAGRVQLEDQIQALRTENEQYRGDSARMNEQLKAYATERTEWKKQLDDNQAQVVSLQEKINSFEANGAPAAQSEGVQIGGAIPGAAAKPSEGSVPTKTASTPAAKEEKASEKTFQVMTVNHKFNFVVIGLGPQDQVKLGDKFQVERGGKVIGSVQIEKTYDHFAAATILEESKEAPVKEGDTVRKA